MPLSRSLFSGVPVRLAFTAVFFSVLCGMVMPYPAWSQTSFHGHARIEKIKGDPTKGYVEQYEYKAFLVPTGTGTGHSYHCGDPGTAIDPYSGCITFPNSNDPSLSAGTYTLFTSLNEFFARGKIVPNVVINNGQQTTQHALQPVDYSGYYDNTSWDPTGGNPVFQTFIATGVGISRVAFAKADATTGGTIDVSILRDTGGNVETWTQVGPTRSVNRGGSGGDHWVSWDGGEVTTTAGNRYAVRLSASNGISIQPFWSNDTFYASGTGYRATQSNPAGHDYYMAVFADNDGTTATIMVRSGNIGNLPSLGWKTMWAQGYTARGTSFAASSLMATVGGSSGWNFTIKAHVHSGSPSGPQVGPTKTVPVAFRPFIGCAGVAFGPGEVPTTPGQLYWIVYENNNGSGFNAVHMTENGGNTYSGGTCRFFDGGSWSGDQSDDLYINLFEYLPSGGPTATPTITPTPVVGANLLQNFGFEQSSGQSHPSWTNPGTFGTNGAFPSPGGAQEGSQWADKSYGGGGFQQFEIYQTVKVSPGSLYRLAAYCNVGGNNGTAVAKLMWKNGSYAGDFSGTLLDSESWAYPSSSIPWTEMSGLVTPTGTQLTIILRNEINGWGGGVNWDNCSVVLQSSGAATATPTRTPTRTPTPTTPAVSTPTRTATPSPTKTPTSGPSPTPFPTQSNVNINLWEGYH